MRIFLVGLMGSGKSREGKKVALEHGLPFFDLDELLEKQEGKSIAELFEEYGEDEFRQKESLLLKTFPFPPDCIVASGGGAPCFFDNLSLMKKMGTIVYMKTDPSIHAQRLFAYKRDRPLIKDAKNPEEIRKIIVQLLEKREVFYSQAHVIADLEQKNFVEVINKLLNG